MNPTRGADLQETLAERGALLSGHFRLSSGRHSDRFIQKFRILEDPALLEPLAARIADRFRSAGPTVVVSAAVGGIVLGYEVARQLHTKAVFVEKEEGVAKLRRGFDVRDGDRALVVEDVITTGLSVREVIEVVRSKGAAIVGAGAIVKRGEADLGVPTFALLDLPIESFDPQVCPQCASGVPISDPGSRRI
ncbi:MAG: orotate phosphoribosyltransferase [Vulcanimicrobiaceae bacterium]